MCGTCGCGQEDQIIYTKPGEGHHHHHHDHDGHSHTHEHSHDNQHTHSKELQLEIDVLAKNNLTAERNRGYFEALNIKTLNLVSSPGSGKTSLLERTIKELDLDFYIIEGDQQTTNDADRIKKAGAPVIQVNTGNGCHLDADMVNIAMKQLQPKKDSVLLIENVGNLVCPSMFDLGETKRVVIISTTEGEDKPLKYPNMFESSQLCIINKTDLLPYLDFDVEKTKEYAKRVNPKLEFIELSVKSGEGMKKWFEWLKKIN